ncbi:MAG: hypothetical protein QOD83_2447, partial [Solirubrobacteraceae bacterium]|nr:hypothetical protein [Solirubrobacteraceae bacterium]
MASDGNSAIQDSDNAFRVVPFDVDL